MTPLFAVEIAATGIALALAVKAWITSRAVAARQAQADTNSRLLPEDITAIRSQVADMLDQRSLSHSADSQFTEISEKLSQLSADVDWFVGERLIEQAVALARSGYPEQEISRATGISLDEVESIRRFRRH